MDSSLQKLAETGLLGLLLVIALLTIGFLYRENKNERNARLADLKEVNLPSEALIKEIKLALENILSLIRNKQ